MDSLWVAVFRAGTWTDSAGRTRQWTVQDLDRIVESYDPAQNEAPVVIGHPKDNAPAYGWVERLKRDGEILWAKLKDLAPEFREWLERKVYKKRSISLYPDGTLRHVGFLGAAPPAVKGLPDPAFRDVDDRDVVEICMDYAQGGVRLHRRGERHAMSLIRSGRVDSRSTWSWSADDGNDLLGDPPDWEAYAAWFLGEDTEQPEETKARWKYPFGKGGKVYRSALIAIRQRAGQQGADAIFEAAGRLLAAIDEEERSMSELEAIKQEMEQLRAEKEAAERERMELAAQLQRREIQAFCERLEQQNKLPPAFRERGLVEFMAALEEQPTEIEFAEGRRQTPAAWFREFLEALPETVPLGAQFTQGAPSAEDHERSLGLKIAGIKE